MALRAIKKHKKNKQKQTNTNKQTNNDWIIETSNDPEIHYLNYQRPVIINLPVHYTAIGLGDT